MDVYAKVDDAIARLQHTCGAHDINQLMAAGFVDLLRTNGVQTGNATPGGLYVSAMEAGWYTGISKPDIVRRETAVLAILTVQGADANLALHVFIALASGMSAREVLDVILLAGMYSGANLLSHAEKVATKTFGAILQAAEGNAADTATVFRCIMDRFPDAALADAKTRLQRP